MTSVSQAKWHLRLKRIIFTALFFGLLVQVSALFGPEFGAKLEALTPPTLLKQAVTSMPERLDQGWSVDESSKFHSITQGTRSFPVPLSWLVALEQPRKYIVGLPFTAPDLFMDDEYILRFGFIKSVPSRFNPHGLPVGIAVTPLQSIPGVSRIEDAVGLTCAACHTGHMTVEGKHFLVEGGAASVDLGLLTKSISAALGQTFVSSKLPFFNSRFDRFANRVLKDNYSDAGVVELKNELSSLVKHLAAVPGGVKVVEGYARLDALNRIGNQSFAVDFERHENYVPPNAPVNYPHIWTAPWFDWVQYDGSIMAPLVRNAGEALGVSAYINLHDLDEESRFSSSINYNNLKWIEDALKGPDVFADDGAFQGFSGLTRPAWPAKMIGEIDQAKAEQGHALYKQHCMMCHLPAVEEPEFANEFFAIPYVSSEEEEKVTEEKRLRVKTIPLDLIGTDPAQANVLANRKINTSGFELSGDTFVNRMGLDNSICVELPIDKSDTEKSTLYPSLARVSTQGGGNAALPSYSEYLAKTYPPKSYQNDDTKLQEVSVKDSAYGSFAYSLGALVNEANDQWYKEKFISEEARKEYDGGMPNCLRAGAGYKARPLDGVWATAPFLHNGSVPTIYDLLSPPAERPKFVQLGGIEFDKTKLGLAQDDSIVERAKEKFNYAESSQCSSDIPMVNEDSDSARKSKDYYIDGYFILDTSVAGNCNSGHAFTDEYEAGGSIPGVIGREFSESERYAIIEFLKTQ